MHPTEEYKLWQEFLDECAQEYPSLEWKTCPLSDTPTNQQREKILDELLLKYASLNYLVYKKWTQKQTTSSY